MSRRKICFLAFGVLLLASVPATGEQARSPRVEFSNRPDERAAPGGDSQVECDPGQLLVTIPKDTLNNGYPNDAIDFFPGEETGCVAPQIDAIANIYDAGYDSLFVGKASLLFSRHPETAGSGSDGPVAVYSIDVQGVVKTKFLQRDLNARDASDPDQVDDLDALETSGPFGTDDATFYSEEGDSDFVSVWTYDGGTASAYLTRAQIHEAVMSLGFSGTESDVDVDAIVVRDADGDRSWTSGDEVLFSLKAAATWDGGEIVRLSFAAGASFLVYAGHTWDTSLDIGGLVGDQQEIEEVDAIEVDTAKADVRVDVELDSTGEVSPGRCEFAFEVRNTGAADLDTFWVEVRDGRTATEAALACFAPVDWTCTACYPHDDAGRAVLRYETSSAALAAGDSLGGFRIELSLSLSPWIGPQGETVGPGTVLAHWTGNEPGSLGVTCASGAFGPYEADGAFWGPDGDAAWICGEAVTAVPATGSTGEAALLSIVPNPASETSRISFRLAETRRVTLRLYDLHGRLVRELVPPSRVDPGRHDVAWDGRSDAGLEVSSGVYFCRLDVEGTILARRLVVLR